MPREILVADNSQISDFMNCETLWYYNYIKRIQPATYRPFALDRGTVIHNLLDTFYSHRHLMSSQDAYKYSIEVLKKNLHRINLTQDELDFLSKRYYMYYLHWEARQGHYKPLVINDKPQVEVGFSIPIVDNEMFYFVFEGKIDLITENLKFVDHKTQSREYDHYAFDTQWLSYSFATKIYLGEINYIGLQKNIVPATFRRQSLALSEGHAERWRKKLIKLFYRMYRAKTSGKYEENDKHCLNKYGPCAFHSLHEALTPTAKDMKILINFGPRPAWEPWSLEE